MELMLTNITFLPRVASTQSTGAYAAVAENKHPPPPPPVL
jgi:hypothetical protein